MGEFAQSKEKEKKGTRLEFFDGVLRKKENAPRIFWRGFEKKKRTDENGKNYF